MEGPKYKDVVIATPMRAGVVGVSYCVGMLTSNGLYGGWLPMTGQSDIYVARNILANNFLENKQFNTLICIDSDIGFTRKNLEDLIECPEPFVSGLYTDKCQPPEPFCRDENGEKVNSAQIPPNGLMRSLFVPGGFLKIERRVLESIIAKKMVPSYGSGKFHQFYNGSIWKENLLSEDYSFCKLVKEAGFQAYTHCGIRLEHDGRTLPPPAEPARLSVPEVKL